jgi:hypothetical protein
MVIAEDTPVCAVRDSTECLWNLARDVLTTVDLSPDGRLRPRESRVFAPGRLEEIQKQLPYGRQTLRRPPQSGQENNENISTNVPTPQPAKQPSPFERALRSEIEINILRDELAKEEFERHKAERQNARGLRVNLALVKLATQQAD